MTRVLPAARRLGVLISGRGSNLQALIDAIASGELEARIAVVISNRAGAGGLDARAAPRGSRPWSSITARSPSRDDYDARLAPELQSAASRLVCLAGFMRLVGAPLLDAFPNAILNIHPSLLPAFPGVDAQPQALAHGVKVSGATVHLVTGELDGGPIVLQAAVPVLDERHGRDAVSPDSRSGAPPLSGGRADDAGRRLAHGRPPIHSRLKGKRRKR